MRERVHQQKKQLYTYFATRFQEIEEEAATQNEHQPGAAKKLIGLVVLASLCMTVVKYFGPRYKTKLPFEAVSTLWPGAMDLHHTLFTNHDFSMLAKNAYWSLSILVFYGVLPYCYVRWVKPQASSVDLGLSTAGALQHWRIYLTFYLVMVVMMIFISDVEAFQKYYPFYKGAGKNLTHFFAWELIYLPTFLAVEFFFRGVLIFPFSKRFGAYSVLIPIMPYCMIHFGKPIQETLGAIAAGLLLGALALATRSIWLGVAIHVSVALTMDVLSLWRKGTLPFLSW